MKKVPIFSMVCFFAPLFFFLSFITSCHQISKENNTDTKIERPQEERSTDFNGAMEYEFNMIKNPATGKIPEGVFEAEKAQAAQIFDSRLFANRIAANTYTFQGPNNLGGRTRAIVYDVRYNGTSNQTILAGGVSGGIYKSTDNGATWVRKSPIGDHFSCTSFAQDTRVGFQDTWYYGVGEASGNSASGSGAFYSGNGVYKSTDNGETWTRLTNSNTTPIETFSTPADFITKVIVNPVNGDVYIACPATIRRSTDGGTTWASVLNGTLANTNQHTDIVVTSTGRFYAGFAGTANLLNFDGVWTSTTGAFGSWTRIAGPGGTPAGWNANGTYGRVVLAIAPSNEDIVCALYFTSNSVACPGAATEAELFRWDNATTSWTNLSTTLPDEVGCSDGNDPFSAQGGYDLVVAVKPDDANTVFIGGTNAYRSTDAGATWTRIGGYASAAGYAQYTNSHPDIHSFVFQPGNSSIMLCGNDGGIQRTINNLAGTVAWSQINIGYRTYQYYYVDIDPRSGNNKVIGGAQDNGTTRNVGGTGTTYENIFSGDGVSVGLSNPNPTIQYEYVGTQQGPIYRRNSTSGSGFGTTITPTGEGGTVGELFVTLFKLDQDNTERLYYANDNALYRTTSASTVASATWTSMTGVATAVGAANDITVLTPSRGTYNAATSSLFFGTSNGRVYRLDDPTGAGAATSPVNITGGSFPVGYISSIAVNPRNDDTVIVTFSNYGVTGNVWWTGNANSATPTWTNIEGSLTLPSFRSSAIVVTPTGVQYFVGTSVGLYTSDGLPGSINWTQEGPTEMGNAVVSSLALRTSDNNLLVGTHGYGMWKTTSLEVLPVTLTKFTGRLQDKKAILEWSTSTEFNSKEFEIQKSFDGINFRKLVAIAAAGNSNSERNYLYEDKEPLTEKNYYRLRSIDLDGKDKISNIVLLKVPDAKQGIIVLGNPFKDNLLIRFIKAPSGRVDLRLFDMSGRIASRQQMNTPGQQVLFNTPQSLGRGIYKLEIFVDGNRFISNVLHQ